MPTLDWIGKAAVVNHHQEVPTKLLHCNGSLSAGDPEAGNLLVEGDNLEALKALLPYYAGKVKCIYIDPPYNTGKDDWRYSDRVDDPVIRQWLNKVIGAESEDFSRHEKWLCMIYPRLRLLRDFLAPNGVIISSIDQNEFPFLRIVMDEILGRRNWVGDIVWKNVNDNNPSRVVTEHEYMVVYARDVRNLEAVWKSSRNDVKSKLESKGNELIASCGGDESKLKKAFASWFRDHKKELWPLQEYDQIDLAGVYTESRSVHNPGKEGYDYEILHPVTKKPTRKPLMGYRFPEETALDLLKRGEIVFGKDESQIIRIKIPLSRYSTKLPSVWEFDGRRGSNEVKAILSESKRPFANPKPSDLLAEILSYVTNDGDLVLDAFAGSGTTGHAVLTLNRKLGGERRFVLVEMMPETAKGITALRLQRVIDGYTRKKKDDQSESVEGLGGGFRYCTLGKPLFDEWGCVTGGVTFGDLAAFIFFSDTGSPIPAKAKRDTSLLGTFEGRAIHLLWSAESAGAADERAGNVLTAERLAKLPKPSPDFDGPVTVYAEGCTVSAERLAAAQVSFRQIPYQVAGV